MRSSRRTAAIVAATCTMLSLPAAAHAGPDPDVARLHGSALVFYPPSPADEVRFTVDAYARYGGLGPWPVRSWGTAHLSHHSPAQNYTVWYSMRVDCLMTGGDTATVTGEVLDASPNAAGWIGDRVGFSVTDRGRRDRVGMTGLLSPYPDDSPAPRKCTAPAAYSTVVGGGYTVTDTDHW
ncbi:hypothetical protein AB0G04_28690 [Actinoplanes sp. NPDC023801]|uniref:hypothetical protein n=1 Tax=Actinoplanes sp. NPDC023801 TaxID=3154595 RepID=UPI0033DF1AB8